MRRYVSVMVVALTAFGMVTATGQASASAPKILCFGSDFQKPPTAKVKPRHCLVSTRTKNISLMSMFRISNVRWTKWSRRVALGSGRYSTQSNRPVAVKMRFSKPRRVCGRVVFARAEFKLRGKDWGRSVPLLTCKR